MFIVEMRQEFAERYNKLNKKAQGEVIEAWQTGDLSKAKEAEAYELAKDVIDYESKKYTKGGKNMVEKKDVIEGKVTEGVKKEVDEKALAIIKKKETLLIKQEMPIQEWRDVVEALYRSGYFKDLQSVAQAITKAQCGRELGFPPYYSLSNFFILPGKPPASSGQVMAALIKRSGYDYRVLKSNDDICIIKFFGLKGEEIGEVSFSYKEADAVVMKTQYGDKKLTSKDSWRNYRVDMLFWRCMARGARRFCPDAIAGLYLKDEIEAEENEEVKGNSDLSVFKVGEQKTLSASETKPSPRKVELDELLAKYGKEKIQDLKKSEKIEKKLIELDEKEWKEFVGKLQKTEEKPKESKPKEEIEFTRDNKLEILKGLKDKYGVNKIKKVKEELKFEGKLADLSNKDFKRFKKEVEKE